MVSLIKRLFSFTTDEKLIPGSLVNLCDAYATILFEGVVMSDIRSGMVYVEWARGASGWYRAKDLCVICEPEAKEA